MSDVSIFENDFDSLFWTSKEYYGFTTFRGNCVNRSSLDMRYKTGGIYPLYSIRALALNGSSAKGVHGYHAKLSLAKELLSIRSFPPEAPVIDRLCNPPLPILPEHKLQRLAS